MDFSGWAALQELLFQGKLGLFLLQSREGQSESLSKVFLSHGHLQWIPCFPQASWEWMALLGSLECLDLHLDCLTQRSWISNIFPAFPEVPAQSTLQSQEDQHHSNSRRIFRDLQPNLVLLLLPFPKIIPGSPFPASVVSLFSVSILCRVPGGAWRGKVGFEGDLWILAAFPRMFLHPWPWRRSWAALQVPTWLLGVDSQPVNPENADVGILAER